MQNTAIVRLVGERLAWYPPGTDAEPRWLDEQLPAENLRAALSQRRMRICFCVPGEDARLLTLSVSSAEKKHLAKSLPFMLEEQVAADVDDLHFAYTALDADTMAVAVCAKESMARYQRAMADFPGINLWLPEPLLLPYVAQQWCLVLEDGKAIVRTGVAQGFTAELDMLQPMLQAQLAEAEPPSSIVVYGADQSADTALLPQSLQDIVQWRHGNLYAALLLSDDLNPTLNLLQGEYLPRLPFARWWGYWRAAAAVFALAFALQLAADYSELQNLTEDNLALRGAVESSYRQAFPKGAVVDAEKQLSRQLDALRGTSESGGFVSLMEQVGKVIQSMPGTSIATINYNDKGDEMRMNLIAADFESVEQLRSKMNAAGLDAVMESSSAQDKGVRARMRVGVRS